MNAHDVYGSSLLGGVEKFITQYWTQFELPSELIPHHKKVLEIGSGFGHTAKEIKQKYDNHVTASDVSDESIKIFAELQGLEEIDDFFKLDIVEDTIDKKSELYDKFEFVMIYEVLEHVSSPYHALINIKNICIDGGYVHISIPDFDHQFGYEGHQHAFVYPGLFIPKYFEAFLNQMYFKIVFYRPFVHAHADSFTENPYTRVKTNGKALHHYYVCQNIKSIDNQDILDVVNSNNDMKEIYRKLMNT